MIYVLQDVKKVYDNGSHYPIIMQRKDLYFSSSLVHNCSIPWRWPQLQAETCRGKRD